MQDKLGRDIHIGSIITNLSSEYSIAIVTGINRESLRVIQWSNADRIWHSGDWGNHVKVTSNLADELDLEKIRKSGSELRRTYIVARRNELLSELDGLNEMERDIFYDG